MNAGPVLHVGNIAQNGYLNAKLLREKGYDCDVLCADYYQIGGNPAWMVIAGEIGSRASLGNDVYPNIFRFASAHAAIPRWFVQGPQRQAIAHLSLKRRGMAEAAELAWCVLRYNAFKAAALQTPAPWAQRWTPADYSAALDALQVADVFVDELDKGAVSEVMIERLRRLVDFVDGTACADALTLPVDPAALDGLFERLRGKLEAADLATARAASVEADEALKTWRDLQSDRSSGRLVALGIETVVKAAAPYRVENEHLKPEDSDFLAGLQAEYEHLWQLYRYRVLYSTTPAFALVSNGRPYAAYEHGTIREIPFADNQIGRLTRASYTMASAVLITNADYCTAERQLEIEPHRRVYVPHGFDSQSVLRFKAEYTPRRREDGLIHFVAPARHDWTTNDPSNDKGNDRIIRAAHRLKSAGRGGFIVSFIAYGKDCDASRRLIEELGVGDCFEWLGLQTQRGLWELYSSAHAVMDQFQIPAIGGIGMECLALGRRLINADNGSLAEFFSEQPPLLGASTADEISERMAQVIDDPEDSRGIGPAAASWFSRRHSDEVIVAGFAAAFRQIEADYPAITAARAAERSRAHEAGSSRRKLSLRERFWRWS